MGENVVVVVAAAVVSVVVVWVAPKHDLTPLLLVSGVREDRGSQLDSHTEAAERGRERERQRERERERWLWV